MVLLAIVVPYLFSFYVILFALKENIYDMLHFKHRFYCSLIYVLISYVTSHLPHLYLQSTRWTVFIFREIRIFMTCAGLFKSISPVLVLTIINDIIILYTINLYTRILPRFLSINIHITRNFFMR